MMTVEDYQRKRQALDDARIKRAQLAERQTLLEQEYTEKLNELTKLGITIEQLPAMIQACQTEIGSLEPYLDVMIRQLLTVEH